MSEFYKNILKSLIGERERKHTWADNRLPDGQTCLNELKKIIWKRLI